MDAEIRRQVEECIRPIVRRMYVWLAIITLFAVGGSVIGAYLAQSTKSADQARGVQLGLADCHRSQQGRRAFALVVHTAIPPHMKGRSKGEQAAVDGFYKKVAPALQVPTCS
jgi:hypothetical protein